jgi:hypothetical protein
VEVSPKSEPIPLSLPTCNESKEAASNKTVTFNKNQESTMWKKIRSGVMFGVACIASPCCTPILVPIAIALLAGTPVAVWLSANLGWIYGGLTVLSIISLVLGFRWMRQKSGSKPSVDARSEAGKQHIQEVTHL